MKKTFISIFTLLFLLLNLSNVYAKDSDLVTGSIEDISVEAGLTMNNSSTTGRTYASTNPAVTRKTVELTIRYIKNDRVLYSSYSDNKIESSNCYASNLFYTKDIFEIIGVKGRHTVKTWYGDIILYTKVGTYS